MSDDIILRDNLITVARGISQHFGSECEACIHDLHAKDLEHTIIYITNGHVTGRKIGDAPSKIVLRAIESLKKGEIVVDHLSYMTKTNDNRTLKSSSMFIKNEAGEYRYLLAINYDLTNLLAFDKGLKSLTTIDSNQTLQDEAPIPLNVNELLDSLIEQSIEIAGKQPQDMDKDDRLKAIRFLDESGAFLITKSTDKVSERFGVSKFTLYSYINQFKEERAEEGKE